MLMKILTTKQAAKALRVNDSRVRQLILSGRLPAIKFGRDWIIQKKDLKKFHNAYRLKIIKTPAP